MPLGCAVFLVYDILLALTVMLMTMVTTMQKKQSTENYPEFCCILALWNPQRKFNKEEIILLKEVCHY